MSTTKQSLGFRLTKSQRPMSIGRDWKNNWREDHDPRIPLPPRHNHQSNSSLRSKHRSEAVTAENLALMDTICRATIPLFPCLLLAGAWLAMREE